ncbi:mediator of RNA polymerase II transcription subunit 12-like isoform X1 [Epinephelus fuscoguttatus]|uniref:mediator of RNA polymerase II transcription subunit 12-like isoform X1 n=1 Tax=Epinephelus fuscoguttatus TaxID=293821 RepID=UPI0020D046F8|nr:mediator of RNA polymerase II transcription subunit 12-like isoform X1 [Epinephelus fuscoguttatus]
MRFSLVFAALLCFTTWMSTVRATNGPVASCCLQWSNTLQRVPLENIVNYTLQTVGLCPIKAVVFETKRGKRICSDPDSARAKKVILKVDKKKETKESQDKPQTEARSASTIAPAVSSTSKHLFEAKNGTSVYSDPDNESATKAMQEVDKEEEKTALQDKPQTESKSASTIAPAVSSTSENLFEAKNGTSVYSDPDNEGATKAMQEVDKEEEKTALQDKPQTEARSASTIAPAVSSTSKHLFEAKNGTSVYSDPDNEGATKAMQEVDKEEEKTALQDKPQTEARFEAKNGTSVCSDPDNEGATKAMQEVDKEEEKTALQDKPQTESKSASTIVPAVSSTSKNAPQSTRSYRRRRQRKRSKGLRNWQRRLA